MLIIDRLILRLPGEFESRATEISRLVAEVLGDMPLQCSAVIDHMVLPRLTVSETAGNVEVAEKIARAIHGRLTKEEV